MPESSTGFLFGVLVLLILMSAFFSGTETGMMALNRYRLRHLVKQGHRGARRVNKLLERPDRLIGLILVGNNFVNILASSIATVVAIRLLGEIGIVVATALLTLVVLIFAEVAPKTLAALNPERVAFPASAVLQPLLKLLYPLVWLVNMLANGLLRMVGVSSAERPVDHLTAEELRTVVKEAGALIPRRHQEMLVGILDLEKVCIEDIMVPRNEVAGIDLDDDWNMVREQLVNAQHTRMPVYRGSLDKIIGILHARNALSLLPRLDFGEDDLLALLREPYFIPEGTPLHTQLRNFQRHKHRVGLVVDEYGDILGLATLEDILEEVVGEFTTEPSDASPDIYPQADGSFLVEANISIRELNRHLHLKLSTRDANTLNGLILEYLEEIPEPGTSFKLEGHAIEVVQTSASAVRSVLIIPKSKLPGAGADSAP